MSDSERLGTDIHSIDALVIKVSSTFKQIGCVPSMCHCPIRSFRNPHMQRYLNFGGSICRDLFGSPVHYSSVFPCLQTRTRVT